MTKVEKQIAAVVIVVPILFGIGYGVATDHDSKPENNSSLPGSTGDSTATSASTQPVVNTSYPAECNTKHFSLLNLYSTPDYNSMVYDVFSTGAEGKAWLAVFANGNYKILDGKLLIDKD